MAKCQAKTENDGMCEHTIITIYRFWRPLASAEKKNNGKVKPGEIGACFFPDTRKNSAAENVVRCKNDIYLWKKRAKKKANTVHVNTIYIFDLVWCVRAMRFFVFFIDTDETRPADESRTMNIEMGLLLPIINERF